MVSVNVAVAVSEGLEPWSVAVTVLPDVPLGTVNAHVNAPTALVDRDPLVQVVIATPRKERVTELETVKPVPRR